MARLQDEIQQGEEFSWIGEEAILDLLRTSDRLQITLIRYIWKRSKKITKAKPVSQSQRFSFRPFQKEV